MTLKSFSSRMSLSKNINFFMPELRLINSYNRSSRQQFLITDTQTKINSGNLDHNLTVETENNLRKSYTAYSPFAQIKYLTIEIASPLRILQWSEKTLPNGRIYGEILNANTLHHKSFKPQKNGLFCERIFGPVKDFECACGKTDKSGRNMIEGRKSTASNSKTSIFSMGAVSPLSHHIADYESEFLDTKHIKNANEIQNFSKKGNELVSEKHFANSNYTSNERVNTFNDKQMHRKFCPICDVEYTWSVIRRYQLGYIKLVSPVTHAWYFKGTPSYLSVLLDMKKRNLQSIIYCIETLNIEYSYSVNKAIQNGQNSGSFYDSPSSIYSSWLKSLNSTSNFTTKSSSNTIMTGSNNNLKLKPTKIISFLDTSLITIKNRYNHNVSHQNKLYQTTPQIFRRSDLVCRFHRKFELNWESYNKILSNPIENKKNYDLIKPLQLPNSGRLSNQKKWKIYKNPFSKKEMKTTINNVKKMSKLFLESSKKIRFSQIPLYNQFLNRYKNHRGFLSKISSEIPLNTMRGNTSNLQYEMISQDQIVSNKLSFNNKKIEFRKSTFFSLPPSKLSRDTVTPFNETISMANQAKKQKDVKFDCISIRTKIRTSRKSDQKSNLITTKNKLENWLLKTKKIKNGLYNSKLLKFVNKTRYMRTEKKIIIDKETLNKRNKITISNDFLFKRFPVFLSRFLKRIYTGQANKYNLNSAMLQNSSNFELHTQLKTNLIYKIFSEREFWDQSIVLLNNLDMGGLIKNYSISKFKLNSCEYNSINTKAIFPVQNPKGFQTRGVEQSTSVNEHSLTVHSKGFKTRLILKAYKSINQKINAHQFLSSYVTTNNNFRVPDLEKPSVFKGKYKELNLLNFSPKYSSNTTPVNLDLSLYTHVQSKNLYIFKSIFKNQPFLSYKNKKRTYLTTQNRMCFMARPLENIEGDCNAFKKFLWRRNKLKQVNRQNKTTQNQYNDRVQCFQIKSPRMILDNSNQNFQWKKDSILKQTINPKLLYLSRTMEQKIPVEFYINLKKTRYLNRKTFPSSIVKAWQKIYKKAFWKACYKMHYFAFVLKDDFSLNHQFSDSFKNWNNSELALFVKKRRQLFHYYRINRTTLQLLTPNYLTQILKMAKFLFNQKYRISLYHFSRINLNTEISSLSLLQKKMQVLEHSTSVIKKPKEFYEHSSGVQDEHLKGVKESQYLSRKTVICTTQSSWYSLESKYKKHTDLDVKENSYFCDSNKQSGNDPNTNKIGSVTVGKFQLNYVVPIQYADLDTIEFNAEQLSCFFVINTESSIPFTTTIRNFWPSRFSQINFMKSLVDFLTQNLFLKLFILGEVYNQGSFYSKINKYKISLFKNPIFDFNYFLQQVNRTYNQVKKIKTRNSISNSLNNLHSTSLESYTQKIQNLNTVQKSNRLGFFQKIHQLFATKSSKLIMFGSFNLNEKCNKTDLVKSLFYEQRFFLKKKMIHKFQRSLTRNESTKDYLSNYNKKRILKNNQTSLIKFNLFCIISKLCQNWLKIKQYKNSINTSFLEQDSFYNRLINTDIKEEPRIPDIETNSTLSTTSHKPYEISTVRFNTNFKKRSNANLSSLVSEKMVPIFKIRRILRWLLREYTLNDISNQLLAVRNQEFKTNFTFNEYNYTSQKADFFGVLTQLSINELSQSEFHISTNPKIQKESTVNKLKQSRKSSKFLYPVRTKFEYLVLEEKNKLQRILQRCSLIHLQKQNMILYCIDNTICEYPTKRNNCASVMNSNNKNVKLLSSAIGFNKNVRLSQLILNSYAINMHFSMVSLIRNGASFYQVDLGFGDFLYNDRYLKTYLGTNLVNSLLNSNQYCKNQPENFYTSNGSSLSSQNNLNQSYKGFSKVISNNCYTLSHRERWGSRSNDGQRWPLFQLYSTTRSNTIDRIITCYRLRVGIFCNTSGVFPLNYTNNTNLQHKNNFETASFFSGPGIIHQFLNELTPVEIRKLDKQNRLLLYQLNQSVFQFKKQSQLFVFDKIAHLELKQLYKKRDFLIRRTQLVRRLFRKHSKPSDMMITVLPVLPPDLRPIVKMGEQVAASDFNRFYQRVIYRNDRLQKFLKDTATSHSYEMKYAQRLLQEAVDNLIQNGSTGGEKDARGRVLKSLSDVLKGKQGRFRQFLLGKRVDYSGRSVIAVGPKLKLHDCGIPLEMALELYLPFLLKIIINKNLARTVVGAKTLIHNNKPMIWQLLRELMQMTPVVLNRAPTLHRLGFQAFIPQLVEGKALLLHPLVCSAFNADFDGDQMAVHVPITVEARAEAWKLMLSRNNMLSPSTGDPLSIPSQDMVLGCYYLTTYSNPSITPMLRGSGVFFNHLHKVLLAYDLQKIDLQAFVWVKWFDFTEDGTNQDEPIEIRISQTGYCQTISKNLIQNYTRFINSSSHSRHNVNNQKMDQYLIDAYQFKNQSALNVSNTKLLLTEPFYSNASLQLLSQYIATTPGRIILNTIIQQIVN